MVSGPAPVLVSVTVCAGLAVSTAWLAKVSEVGDKLTPGALAPVPVRLTIWGLPLAVSVIVTLPVKVPVVVGVNVTLIVQAAPAATEEPQVLVSPKFVLAVIEVMEIAAVPVLLRVTTCAALVVPTT
jgi:hypothetical protein